MLEALGESFARLGDVASGLIVLPTVLERQPNVAYDLRVVRVLEVVYVVLYCRKVHWGFYMCEITWRLY